MSIPFLRRTILASSAGLLTALGMFLSSVLVARILGPEGTGIVAFATWVSATAVTLFGLGLPLTLERYVAELNARGSKSEVRLLTAQLLRMTLLMLPLTGAGFAAIRFLFSAGSLDVTAGLAPSALADPAIGTLLLALFAVQALAALYYAYCRATQRFTEFAYLALASTSIQLIGITLGALLWGVHGAIAGYIVGFVMPACFALRLSRTASGVLNAKLRRRIVRFSGPAWIISVLNALVATRTEIVFIESWWGSEYVGLFAIALALANLAAVLPSLLSGALLAYLSEQFGLQDRASMQLAYRLATLVVGLSVFPVCFGLAAISPALVPLLFGETFSAAVPATAILAIAAGVSVIAATAPNMIYSLEHGHFLIISNLVGLALMVAAGLLIIPLYGLLGAALARAVVQGVVVMLEAWYVQRRLQFSLPLKPLIGLLAASAFSGACAFGVVQTLTGPLALAIAVPIGIAAYWLAIRQLNIIDELDEPILAKAIESSPLGISDFLSFLLRSLGRKLYC